MNQYCFFLVLFITVLFGCDKDGNDSEKSSSESFFFEDGFETQNNTLDELFPSDASRWSTIQQTNPSNAINEISITSSLSSEGMDALHILAHESDSKLSKMDIEKNGLYIKSGDKVTISADFYINGTQALQDLLLIDLECCSCWDPNVGDNYGAENQCPGVRLMMSGGNDFLSIERGKISCKTITQNEFAFPRNQWVSVVWEMILSDENNGQNRLVLNGIEVINENAMNMPNAQIFKNVFADEGIDFDLQQPIFYERVQVGVTANATAENIELFVDNFSIKVE